MSAGDMVRVPPEVTRKLITQHRALVLAVGSTPGAAYPLKEGQ